jgi:catechol 2,3-dioxygenase-like lactoylglutathione lyase family enzyme
MQLGGAKRITEGAMIKGLHHNAYRCRDSEETRKFYEDFLGLPLCAAQHIKETKTGRETNALHTFYRLEDGSYLAFFEVCDQGFNFKPRHDFDLHIALEVQRSLLEQLKQRGEVAGIETRGIADHGMIESIYFRDPNGYVIELTAKRPNHDDLMDPRKNGARANLERWQVERDRLSREYCEGGSTSPALAALGMAK